MGVPREWDDLLLWAAGLVAAVIALVTAAARYIVRPIYDTTVGDKIDHLGESLTEQLGDIAEGFATKLAAHIADAEGKITAVHEDARRAADAAAAAAAEARRAHQRIDQCLMRFSGHEGPGRRAGDAPEVED